MACAGGAVRSWRRWRDRHLACCSQPSTRLKRPGFLCPRRASSSRDKQRRAFADHRKPPRRSVSGSGRYPRSGARREQAARARHPTETPSGLVIESAVPHSTRSVRPRSSDQRCGLRHGQRVPLRALSKSTEPRPAQAQAGSERRSRTIDAGGTKAGGRQSAGGPSQGWPRRAALPDG